MSNYLDDGGGKIKALCGLGHRNVIIKTSIQSFQIISNNAKKMTNTSLLITQKSG
jgi:hypothetical protein